jgi:hypothetical protein
VSRARPTPPPSRPDGRRTPWWRRTSAIVLAVGALAAAVTAVITLVTTLTPDPDRVDRVTITAAALTTQPLSSYAATAVLRPIPTGGQGNVVDVPALVPEPWNTATTDADTSSSPEASTEATETSSEPPETTTAEPTETTSSAPSTTSSTPVTTTSDSPTSTSSEPDAPADFTPDPDVSSVLETDEQTDVYCDMVVEPTVVDIELPTCEEAQDVALEVEGGGEVSMPPPVPAPGNARLDDQGQPAPPEVAAERLAESLEGVRSVRTEDKIDPVGIRATVSLEIEGMRGRTLALYWRLSAAPGGTALPTEWATPVPACRLVPGTDLDTASIDVWIPLPDSSGPFLLDFYVATETAALTSYRTEAFD